MGLVPRWSRKPLVSRFTTGFVTFCHWKHEKRDNGNELKFPNKNSISKSVRNFSDMQPIPLRIGPDRCLYHIPPSALRGRPARPPVRARLLDIRNFNILFGNFILGRTVHIEMCNIVLIPSLNSCGHPSSCRNFHPIENRPNTEKLTKIGLLTPLPVFAPETAYRNRYQGAWLVQTQLAWTRATRRL